MKSNANSNISSILYKYRDWDKECHKRIITERELYFASPAEFNDPFDSALPLVYRKEDQTQENMFQKMYTLAKWKYPKKTDTEIHELCFSEQQKRLWEDPHHQERSHELLREQNRRNVGIVSLSAVNNNYLMWSHYAQSHRGFCVGFDSVVLENATSEKIEPAIYQDSFPEYSLLNEEVDSFIRKSVMVKWTVWKEECEFRLCEVGTTKKTVQLPSEAYREIIFGCMMDAKVKLHLVDFIRNNLFSTKVYEMQLNKTQFGLDLHPILV